MYDMYAKFKWETLLHVGPVSVPAEAVAHFVGNYYQMYDIMSSAHAWEATCFVFNITVTKS